MQFKKKIHVGKEVGPEGLYDLFAHVHFFLIA